MTRQIFVNIPQNLLEISAPHLMDSIEEKLKEEFFGYQVDVQPAYKRQSLLEVSIDDSAMPDIDYWNLYYLTCSEVLKIINQELDNLNIPLSMR
jgi:hypothetical protein